MVIGITNSPRRATGGGPPSIRPISEITEPFLKNLEIKSIATQRLKSIPALLIA